MLYSSHILYDGNEYHQSLSKCDFPKIFFPKKDKETYDHKVELIRISYIIENLFYEFSKLSVNSKNIAKGTTDPRSEFIFPK